MTPENQNRVVSMTSLRRAGGLICLSLMAVLLSSSADWGISKESEDRIPRLLQSLKSADAVAREEAIFNLRILDSENQLGERREEVIVALKHGLSDSEKPVRYNAAIALGFIDPSIGEGLPVLIEALEDEEADSGVHSGCVAIINLMGPAAKDAVPALIKSRNRNSGWLSDVFFVATLEKIGTTEALNGIKPWLRWRMRLARALMKPGPNLVLFLGFLILFCWNHWLWMKGSGVFHWSLIVPIIVFGANSCVIWLVKNPIMVYLAYIYEILLGVAVVGLAPWLLSFLRVRRRERAAS